MPVKDHRRCTSRIRAGGKREDLEGAFGVNDSVTHYERQSDVEIFAPSRPQTTDCLKGVGHRPGLV